MDDYYVIEWRYRNPDAMLFNYWRRHGAYYGGGTLTTELTKGQVCQELPLLIENGQIEFKVIKVTHEIVDHRSFL